MQGERDKMAAGQWYCCLDAGLDRLRMVARDAVHAHNTLPPAARGAIAAPLRALFADAGNGCFIEAPFHCAYGINIRLGKNVYLNAGCTILDSAAVSIGDGTMIGPSVQIYCSEHHKDPALRISGLERALPVTIGHAVWIGGGAIILPGIAIGDGAIIGAGSVVTRPVAAHTTVVGNPARVMARTADIDVDP